MSHVPIETVEEDAADLQFPKGMLHFHIIGFLLYSLFQVTAIQLFYFIFFPANCYFDSGTIAKPLLEIIQHKIKKTDTIHCNICNSILIEPYITCAQCIRHLSCLKCFANGGETSMHSSNHNYIITHDNIKLFPNSNWSAREECRLLELIQQHGFGNWNDIAKSIQTKDPTECQKHYLDNYFDGIFTKTCGLTKDGYKRIVNPFLYKSNSIDPPRHTMEMINSKLMAGYRFARSDFDTPYDVSAESLVSHLHTPTEWGNDYAEIGDELNATMVAAYNNRLR